MFRLFSNIRLSFLHDFIPCPLHLPVHHLFPSSARLNACLVTLSRFLLNGYTISPQDLSVCLLCGFIHPTLQRYQRKKITTCGPPKIGLYLLRRVDELSLVLSSLVSLRSLVLSLACSHVRTFAHSSAFAYGVYVCLSSPCCFGHLLRGPGKAENNTNCT